jgi:inositol oxygenase
MNFFRLGVNAAFILRKYGIRIVREEEGLPREARRQKQKFLEQARVIYNRHLEQTAVTVATLDRKYETPVLGDIRMWDLLALLGRCIDPSDPALYCVSQLVHCLQIVSGMEDDGIDDAELLLTGLIHDLGKILLLTGEAPENVVCGNTPIGAYHAGIGLDQCLFQWNHDRFVYSRLKDLVPDHVAWLLRYHSIYVPECEHLMDERDRAYTERYLRVFQQYDKGTKSLYVPPTARLETYRDLIEERFPKPIAF